MKEKATTVLSGTFARFHVGLDEIKKQQTRGAILFFFPSLGENFTWS